MTKPLGFQLTPLSLSWIAEETRDSIQTAAQLVIALDDVFTEVVFDSGKSETIDSLSFTPEITLKPCTRYYWRVTVWGDGGDTATSDVEWFETAKMETPWQASWITPDLDAQKHPLIRHDFVLEQEVVSARAYVCGLGIYEMQINGQRVGSEYLTPGFHSYDFWLQYQTYDISDLVKKGSNGVGFALGNGWYKGRFGFDGGYENLYGEEFALICEMHIRLKDGSAIIIGSDDSWKATEGPTTFSNIYDGETYDTNREIAGWSQGGFDDKEWDGVHLAEIGLERLSERLSLPVLIKEERKPIELIHTPADEWVLDLGQNMTGWVRFRTKAAKGTELVLEYSEILQDGCFYRDNLRTAKAAYHFIADGGEREVQPQFTFYGFRYVKLTGFGDDINPDDFTGCVMYSDLEQIGFVETSDSRVNQLFKNALWGQKGNFLDVPTDCPQRDERMGWTGDAQIFASTASFNMYTPAFFTKFMKDMREEQNALGGSIPFIVPNIKPKQWKGFAMGHGASAWSDAATVIPWTMYTHYGDKSLLEAQFATMKDWVDYIKGIDESTGASRLWKVGFHFADWLALDGKEAGGVMGGTDPHYIASAYYCYSTGMVAKAARALGKTEMAAAYAKLAEEIKTAIQKEYFTPNGRSAINTQTGMIIALYMDLVPENFRPRLIEDLKAKLRDDNMHLKTGFVGTPYFCPVLSDNGANDYAYRLLFNDDYPSWLYAVKMGATTIWERWNSVLEDGSISGTGMNSLNHYAYGSIADWMYRYMCGINPSEDAPGFRKVTIAPKPYGRLKYAKALLNSASGIYESGWSIAEDGRLTFNIRVPFNAQAELVLPDAVLETVLIAGKTLAEAGLAGSQVGSKVHLTLKAGSYEFQYMPGVSYIVRYGVASLKMDLMENPETKAVLAACLGGLMHKPDLTFLNGDKMLREILMPFVASGEISRELYEEIDEKLSAVALR